MLFDKRCVATSWFSDIIGRCSCDACDAINYSQTNLLNGLLSGYIGRSGS